MKYRALFFDIDGTLVSFASHRIPRSAVDALREAKRRAVRIFISTGRPRFMVNNLGEIEDLIDGWITYNGGVCSLGDRVIRSNAISEASFRTMLSHSDRCRYPVLVVGERSMVAYNCDSRMLDFYRSINVDLDLGPTIADLDGERIIQTTNFCDAAQERELLPLIPDCTASRWRPDFIDVTERHSDKGTGLVAIAEAAGIDVRETIAFGDGGNDLSMMRAAGLSVALGGAFDEVKREASYVTGDVDADGVASALAHFGVI